MNIQLGAWYWSSLIKKVKYPELALAAYNGGLDNVQRWKNKWAGASNDLEMFVADIGFDETKRYVMAVFAAHAAYAQIETGSEKPQAGLGNARDSHSDSSLAAPGFTKYP